MPPVSPAVDIRQRSESPSTSEARIVNPQIVVDFQWTIGGTLVVRGESPEPTTKLVSERISEFTVEFWRPPTRAPPLE